MSTNKKKRMKHTIHTIELPMPLRMGSVNAYLVEISTGFVLVDTGLTRGRGILEWAFADAECGPDELKLIVITHGDFDHIGNARYLRESFSAQIAMHEGDAAMAKTGDMFAGRIAHPNALVRAAVPKMTKFGKADRFKPNILLEDGQTLEKWGLDATVLSLPGHSAGSIGLLTAEGDLIAGDLFENTKTPQLNSIMDDPEQAEASLARLRSLEIRRVYPGHGASFKLEELVDGT